MRGEPVRHHRCAGGRCEDGPDRPQRVRRGAVGGCAGSVSGPVLDAWPAQWPRNCRDGGGNSGGGGGGRKCAGGALGEKACALASDR